MTCSRKNHSIRSATPECLRSCLPPPTHFHPKALAPCRQFRIAPETPWTAAWRLPWTGAEDAGKPPPKPAEAGTATQIVLRSSDSLVEWTIHQSVQEIAAIRGAASQRKQKGFAVDKLLISD